jgi:hypothetical protein
LAAKGALCGEATPTSLYSRRAARLAHETIPGAKIIVLLREPAARAVSHYNHQVRFGRETRPIDEVFSEDNITRWQKGDCPVLAWRNYFKWSDYATGVEYWLANFPKEQVLIVEAESMFGDPQAALDQSCDFLNKSRIKLSRIEAFNAGQSKSPKPRLFRSLKDAFSRENESLRQLGYSLSWM